MKKHLLLFVILAVSATLFAQQVPREEVVLEIGTGTWCPYCPGAAMGADDLIANGCHVAVMENHNGDSFANVYSNARNSYYAISGYPTAKFDGLLTKVGGSHTQSMYAQYLPLYNQRIAIPSPFTIEMSGNHTGNDYTVQLNITKVASYSGSNLVAHLSLTESEIMYSWQGQSKLNFVNRLMAPSASGTPLNFTGGNTQVVVLNFTFNPSWVSNHCELVAFIQANSNKEIYQGIKLPLNDLQPSYTDDAGLVDIYNYPVYSCMGEVTPSVTLRNGGSANLTSVDIKYSVNGGPLTTYNWTGNLGFMQDADVSLPFSFFTVGTANQIKAYTTNPNGTADQNPVNDTITGSFGQASEWTSVIAMELKTDNNPGETTWELVNASGQVLYSGGPYTGQPNTLIQETFALAEEDCYAFHIYDSGGNGICCSNGNGYCKLTDYFGQELYNSGEFGHSALMEFTLSGIILELKAFLEGPFSSGTGIMYKFLNTYGFLPLSQPYSVPPWNYTGTESVASIPNGNIVDWVLLELRETSGGPSSATSGTIVAQRAALIRDNGHIVDLDGVSPISFDLDITQNLFIVIRHRNHLPVMSENPVPVTGRVYTYDFSSDANQAYGGPLAMKEVGTGVWGFFSGDGIPDGQVSNADKVEAWAMNAGQSGYLAGDFNMNSNVDNQDKIEGWNPNSGLGTQVPY
ncbi:MAG: hypothetical protein JW861_09575 [Bacteroidales bacterium]|nr:hypothetical protein [Bacteroidales bacterium]